MWKTTFGEAGIDAILGGAGASTVLGPEVIGAEIALMGMILGIKKLKQHHQEKKQRKDDQQNAQRQLEEQKFKEEEEYQAQLQREREAEEQKQKEDERQRQEEEARRQQEEAKLQQDAKSRGYQEAMEELDRRQAERRAQRQQMLDQEEVNLYQQRDQRIRQMEQNAGFIRANDVTPFPGEEFVGRNQEINQERMNNIPNADHPDYQQPDPWRYPINPAGGPDDDPNDPNGGPGGNPNNPDDNENFNPFNNRNPNGWRYDPFKDIIDAMSRQIAKNVDFSQKQKEEQNYPGKDGSGTYDPEEMPGKGGSGTYKPEYWTDEYKQQNPDKVKQAESQNQDQPYIDYSNDLQTMEYQMMGLMEGLSQNELTMEQSFVEMEKIEQTLKQKVPDKVRIQPTQIYSSTLARF